MSLMERARLNAGAPADFRSVARAFGSACVMGFTPYHWIYCQYPGKERLPLHADVSGLGPTLGSLLAVGCYALLRAIRYW